MSNFSFSFSISSRENGVDFVIIIRAIIAWYILFILDTYYLIHNTKYMPGQSSDPKIDVTSPYTPRRPAPIVSLSINHPIGTLLRKIKNFLTHKQTLFATTFTIKITPI